MLTSRETPEQRQYSTLDKVIADVEAEVEQKMAEVTEFRKLLADLRAAQKVKAPR